MTDYNKLCFDDLFCCGGASIIVEQKFFKTVSEEYTHFRRVVKNFSKENMLNYEQESMKRAETLKKTLQRYVSGLEEIVFCGDLKDINLRLTLHVFNNSKGTAKLTLGRFPEIHITDLNIYTL